MVPLPNLRALRDLYEIRAVVSAMAQCCASCTAFAAAYSTTEYDSVSLTDIDCGNSHYNDTICHAEMGAARIMAGKHVLVENPSR